MATERTPLVNPSEHSSASAGSGGSTPAYFLGGAHRRKPSNAGSVGSASLKDARANSMKHRVQRDETVDSMPRGTIAPEFDPRPVLGSRPPPPNGGGAGRRHMKGPSIGGGWLGYVAGAFSPSPEETNNIANREDPALNAGEIGTLILPRKVPLKVEPKVHFANERTFLAWLHLVVILAAASVTIVTYSHDDDLANQLYGVVLLPVSVAYIFYALWQYKRRWRMIKNKEPGPFIDVAGPTTLTIILMASITAQFCVKLNAFREEEMERQILS